MALFGKKIKRAPPAVEEAVILKTWQRQKAKTEGASVKVLGSGCAKCNQLEAATKAALEQWAWTQQSIM